MQQQGRRLAEIEALRADFKRSRFDRAGSLFGDGSLVALMIANFVTACSTGAPLARARGAAALQPQYSDPRFGSGGFGRGTVWGGGLGDILGEMERGGLGVAEGASGWLGRRPRRWQCPRGGGGGFRTGGGF